MSNIEVSTDKQRLDIDVIHHFLSTDAYWSKAMPRDVLLRAVQNSLCFGLYLDDKQIGFARVVSDFATFAYLADVFVLPEHRGAGHGKILMNAVHAHPDLQNLRRHMLVTRDAHSLYQHYGFTALAKPENVMERHNPNIYQIL